MTDKTCPKCKLLKSYSDYHKSKTDTNGVQSMCKLCQKAILKVRRKENPEHYNALRREDSRKNRARETEYQRWRTRKLVYGIDKDQFNILLTQQGNACAICESTKPGGKGSWHVDHDHELNYVRGLLCHYCNIGLGHFKDSPTLLSKAAQYLNTKEDKIK